MGSEPAWQGRVSELAKRNWDAQGIRTRLDILRNRDIAVQDLDWSELSRDHEKVLDRVQFKAEEYVYLTRNCAKGSLLALMDEFCLGRWEMVRAMSPFPGFGMTGGICGGVSGSIFALGLFFGSDDPEDYAGTGRAVSAVRNFIPQFKKMLGSIMCPDIQEHVVLGRYMDPRASEESLKAFQEALGYEKCALVPGVGARLAAEIILNSQVT